MREYDDGRKPRIFTLAKQAGWIDYAPSLTNYVEPDVCEFALHTWASWHVQAGTSLFILKELGGWETLEMVRKYAHLDASHLARYVNHGTFRSPLS